MAQNGIKLHCLGGYREVGRNAMLLETGDKNVMFDYGSKIETGEAPLQPKPRTDALFVTHGHLDHTGSCPILYKQTHCANYMTAPTSDYSDLLLHDSLKIARIKNTQLKYGPADVLGFQRSIKKVHYGDEIKLSPKTRVDIWDAGHLPGSAMFVLHSQGKKILYTGDFKIDPQRVVAGARYDAKNIDTVLMETTYSSRDHPDRKQSEKDLYKAISKVVEGGGIALLPIFAVRAPELLMVLDQFGANWPIYVDGMAKEATRIAMAHPEFVKDPDALHKAVDNSIPLYETEERNNAMKEPGVILTTGAAMEGGPIVHYMKKLYSREDCSILFTGYQIPKTAGRYLLDTGQYIVGAINFKVKMPIQSFDFSAHAGRAELLKFVQKIQPRKVVCLHGEYCEKFATELKGRFGVDAIAPKIGDVVKL